MGLFDSIKENVTNKVEGVAGQGLTAQLFDMFGGNSAEGLRTVLDLLHQKGLGDIVSSWVGKGPNKPISGEQLEHALGSERLQEIAGRVGLSKNAVRDQLAQHLPEAVDRATPDGELPHAA